jgi:hypothetical protein
VVLAWLAVGITWAASIGRYGGPDEPAHVLRAYAVAHGDVDGDRVSDLPSGYRGVTVPRTLGTGDPTCYRHDATLPSTCSVPTPPHEGTVYVATSAGVAPPLYYALVGLPARVLGVADDPLAYRFVALAWVAVVLAFAAVRARALGRAALTMLVLVPPSAWFLLGVVNPNSLEIALCALAWVGVARVRRSGTTTAADIAWIGVPLGVAVAMRPIALVAAVAVVSVLVVDPRTRPTWRGAALLAMPAVIGGVSVLAWQRVIGWDGTDPRTAVTGSLWRALRDSVGGLGRTAGELIGTTGWLEVSLPVPVKVAWLALLAAVLARTRAARSVRVRARTAATARAERGAWAVWGLVLVGTPVAFETVFSSSIGPIWQGRYSVPVFIGLGALVASRGGTRWRDLRLLVVAALAVECASFVVTVRRYSVGIGGSWWLHDAAPTSRWLTPQAWVLVHLAVVTAIGVWLWRLGQPRPSEHVAEHVDDDVGVARVVEHGELPG